MNFENMIMDVKKGKTFTKSSWNSEKYIKMIDSVIYLIDSKNAKIIINYFPENGDVEAEDWDEFDPPILKTERGKKEKRNVSTFTERQKRIQEKRFELQTLDIPRNELDAIDDELGAHMVTKISPECSLPYEEYTVDK